ncbi:MAG: GGDEF domain-containing protein, partial [Termitinemataceae bacterium]
VLKTLARLLDSNTERATDLVARYGGEEFVVVLPHTDEIGAETMAERIMYALEQEAIPHEASFVVPVVTVSIGIATAIPAANEYPYTLVAQSDQALYQAKAEGRNCYRVAKR